MPAQTSARVQLVAAPHLKIGIRNLDIGISPSAAALARAAFRANAAGAGADHLVAAAMRAGDVHEHVAERFCYTLGVGVAVAGRRRTAFVRRVIRDRHRSLPCRRCARDPRPVD